MPHQMHILLIDDNAQQIRQFVEACSVRFPEARIVGVADGRQALVELAADPHPAAILLDLHMPMISGFTILESLRQHPRWKDIPVIIFTMDDSDAARYACERLGAAYYQIKPTSRTGFAAFATFLQTGLANGLFKPPSP